ncbi:MAG: hypothetical protein FWE07_07115 [Turicibacter sp.]|nr:hypothetical protein [Turicibacter sp.]
MKKNNLIAILVMLTFSVIVTGCSGESANDANGLENTEVEMEICPIEPDADSEAEDSGC